MIRSESGGATFAAVLVVLAFVTTIAMLPAPAGAQPGDTTLIASDVVFDEDEQSQTFRLEVRDAGIEDGDDVDQYVTIENANLSDAYDDITVGDVEVRVTGSDHESVDADVVAVGDDASASNGDGLVEIRLQVPEEATVDDVDLTVVVEDALDLDEHPVEPGALDAFEIHEETSTGDEQLVDPGSTSVHDYFAVHAENAAQLEDVDDTDFDYVRDKPVVVTNDTATRDGTALGAIDAANWKRGEQLPIRVIDTDDDGEEFIDARQARVVVQEAESGDLYAQIGTGRLDSGEEYILLADDNVSQGDHPDDREGSIRFGIEDQDLTAEWEGDTASDDDEAFELEIGFDDEPRSDYNVEISADGLDYDDLEELFGHLPVADVNDVPRTDERQGDEPRFDQRADDDAITLAIDGVEDELIADFSEADLDPGTYDFDVEVTDADASATASLLVGEETVTFDQNLYTRPAGDLVEITVEMEFTDEIWVQFGDEDAGFVDVLYLEDGNDNDEVSFVVNTRLLGTDHSQLDSVSEFDSDIVYHSEDDVVQSYIHDVAVPGGVPGEQVAQAEFYADADLEEPFDVDGTGQDAFEEYLQELGLIGPDDDPTDQLSRPLQPTAYDVVVDRRQHFVAEDGEASVGEQISAVEVDLVQPTVREIESMVAPTADANEYGTVAELRAESTLTTSEEVAIDDLAVLRFEATGLVGAMAAIDYAENGNDIDDGLEDGFAPNVLHELAVDDGSWAWEGEGIELGYEEQGVINRDPGELALDEANADAAYVLVDQQEAEGDPGEVYLVVDTRDEPFTRGLGEAVFEAEFEYDGGETRFSFDGSDGVLGGAGGLTDEPAYPYFAPEVTRGDTETITFEERSVRFDHFDGDVVHVPPDEDAAISGTTNVAPGSNAIVGVRLMPPDENIPEEDPSFLAESDVVIEEDGSFETELDLEDRTLGEEGFLQFRIDERPPDTLDVVDVRFSDLEDVEVAFFEVDVDTPAEIQPNETFDVTATVTNVGDASGSARLTLAVDGSVVVDDEFALEPGESESVMQSVEAGNTDIAIVATTQDEATTTTVGVTDASDDADAEDEEVEENPDQDDESDDDEDVIEPAPEEEEGEDGLPGFGIGVAILGLFGALALASRLR